MTREYENEAKERALSITAFLHYRMKLRQRSLLCTAVYRVQCNLEVRREK